MGGIDYHWYHYQKSTAAGGRDPIGPLHAGWLAIEVDWLRRLLEAHGLDGRVTVYETGTSGKEAEAEGYIPSSASSPASFQASEVFRRLLGSWLGGGERMGWHSWMAAGATYAGFGLRKDTQEPEHSASEAAARSAFFAVNRLGAFFASASAVRLVRPDLDSTPFPAREDLVLTVPTAASVFAGEDVFPNPGVFVFELEAPTFGIITSVDLSAHRYAYVVMVDPATRDTSSHVVEMLAEEGDAEAFQIEPFVDDPAPFLEAVPADVDPELWLPRYDLAGSIAVPDHLPIPSPGGAVVELVAGGRPVIIAARERLRWPEPG